MGKMKLRRCILYLIILLSSCVLFSCQSKNTNEEKINQHKVSTYQHQGLQRYDEEIDISFVGAMSDNIRELESHFPSETFTDNRWTRIYQKELGININYDWIVDSAFYNQRLANELASGNLPDVIKVDALQMRQLATAGLIQELTEVYETYATPFTKQVISQEAIDPLEVAMIGKKLMGIPEVESSLDTMQYIWIRTDWLENLELDPPKTMDDLLTISKAFTHNDPNQSGKNDTYGLALSNYLWDSIGGISGFMAGFGAYPTIWLESADGQLIYGGLEDEVKDALTVLQGMYQDGQIDPEFMFQDQNHVKEQVINGEVGMLYGQQWASFFVQESLEHDEDADWQVFPIVSNTNQPPKMPISHHISHFWVVRSNYDYPEAIVKLINLHLEKNWGETAEYERYYSTPHAVWQLSPVTPSPINKNLDAFRQIDQARKLGELSTLQGEAKTIYQLINAYEEEQDMDGWGWNKTYGINGAYAILDTFVENDQLIYNQFIWPETETMIELSTMLNNLQLNRYQNIILGNPIRQFDQYIDDWYKFGGLEITKEVNELYQAHQD